jgi:hypothetical protein
MIGSKMAHQELNDLLVIVVRLSLDMVGVSDIVAGRGKTFFLW